MRVVAGVVLAAAVWGCASGPPELEVRSSEPEEPVEASAVVVLPVNLQVPDATSWGVYDRTRGLLRHVERDGRLSAISSWETRRLTEPSAGMGSFDASTLGRVVDEHGIDRDEVLTLHSSVRAGIATVVSERIGKDGTRTRRKTEGTATAEVVIEHTATGRQLVRAVARRPVQPSRAGMGEDPAPWLAEALAVATMAALDQLSDVASIPEPRNEMPCVELAENPRAGFKLGVKDKPSFEQHLASLDPVVAEAKRLMRFEQALPGLSAEAVRAMEDAPLGLLVLDDHALLRRGDVVTHVDGHRVRWTFEWTRAAHANAVGRLPLTIVRDGAEVDLSTPADEVARVCDRRTTTAQVP